LLPVTYLGGLASGKHSLLEVMYFAMYCDGCVYLDPSKKNSRLLENVWHQIIFITCGLNTYSRYSIIWIDCTKTWHGTL